MGQRRQKNGPSARLQTVKGKLCFRGDNLVLTLNGGYSVFTDSIKKNKELSKTFFRKNLGTKSVWK